MPDDRCARSHPRDEDSRRNARLSDGPQLVRDFEVVTLHEDPCYRAGGLEVVCAAAIARVELLERQLAAQEQTARRALYPRGERVENVVHLIRKNKDAPARPIPPGA